jgi:demethylmenaquinone methyltransferase / 2-methoxy-6-polyprenyl-1,4-benzoquinol methylase
MDDTATVSYGFQNVRPEEKTEKVGSVFRRVARRYDVMNDVMSGGLHRLWKDHFVERVRPRSGETILDMAGGTGDIAFRLARASAQVTVADINPAMLDVGRDRAQRRDISGLTWTEANAEQLAFPDRTFDAYSIAFGIRNVTDIEAALHEAWRVLKPGGRFFCLEFSRVTLPGLAPIYERYTMKVVPKLGRWIARDEEAYRYLVESIQRFPDSERFRRMIQAAGFANVRAETLLGGVVAIHSGWRI